MLARNRNLLIIAVAIFTTSFAIGFITPTATGSDFGDNYTHQEITTTNILSNNLQILFLLQGGGITLGSTTLMNLVFNGASTGIFFKTGLEEYTLKYLLALTGTHMIPELLAIFLAGTAGFKIPFELARYLLGKKDYVLNRRELKDYVYLSLVSVVLIVIAAWIEANVTLRIAESFS